MVLDGFKWFWKGLEVFWEGLEGVGRAGKGWEEVDGPLQHPKTRPSVRRPSVRPPSVRRPSVRRPSVRPSAVRPSVRRPSAVRPSVRRPSVRPSAVRPSVLLPQWMGVCDPTTQQASKFRFLNVFLYFFQVLRLIGRKSI